MGCSWWWWCGGAVAPLNVREVTNSFITIDVTDDIILVSDPNGEPNATLSAPTASDVGRLIRIVNNSIEAGGGGSIVFVTNGPVSKQTIFSNRAITITAALTGATPTLKWYVVGGF